MNKYIGFREAYNKGYHDGLEEGISQTTQKLVREILKDFKVEAKVTPFKGLADDDDGTLPQTDKWIVYPHEIRCRNCGYTVEISEYINIRDLVSTLKCPICQAKGADDETN